jgi:hypothetical protein
VNTTASTARIRTVPESHILYDAFGAGSTGGSIVALFFLLLDTIQGRTFFTPSLMGTVLFTSTPAQSVTGVRMDMVAYYTLVHFAVFGVLGGAVAVLLRQVELHSKHPAVMLATIFLLTEVLFVAAAAIMMPGVVAVVGAPRIVAANLLGAAGMASFLLATHRPDLWYRVKHAVHLA